VDRLGYDDGDRLKRERSGVLSHGQASEPERAELLRLAVHDACLCAIGRAYVIEGSVESADKLI
jgi:hypothetical protein